MKYALINAAQVVEDVVEFNGTEIVAPEGGFIAETGMFKKGDFYGVSGFPTFSEIDGTDEAPPTAPEAPVESEAPADVEPAADEVAPDAQ